MQASGLADPGSNPSRGVIFLQKLSGKSEQDFGILRKVVNSYFKKILEAAASNHFDEIFTQYLLSKNYIK